MRSSAIFRTVFSEIQNVNPLDAELKTDFNAKWPFKVIQGHPFRYHERGSYIAQYNNCGLRCEGSEEIAGEISENRHFRRPHSHLKPHRQRTPAKIRPAASGGVLRRPAAFRPTVQNLASPIERADHHCINSRPTN